MGRAPCCEKLGLKKGRWTAEEDELLTNYIREHGEGSWRSLPKNAGLLRCGKSCRLRWINYLRADLKRGNITAEEEETIIKLHNALGNRWSLIAEHFPGRTDNEIKNYWNSHLRRKINGFSKQHGKESPTIFMNSMAKLASRNRKVGSTKTSQPVVKKSKNMNYQVSTAKISPMKPDQTDVMTLLLDQSLATDQKPIGSTNFPGTNLGQIEKLLGTKGKEEDGIDFSKGMAELGPNELLDREVKSLNYVIEGGVLDKPPTGNIDLKEKRESVAESCTTNEEYKVLSGEAKEDQSEEWHTSSSSAMNSAFDEDGIWLDWNWEGCYNIESHNNGNEMWDLSEYEEGEKVFSLWESGTTQGNSGMDPTEKVLQVVQNQN